MKTNILYCVLNWGLGHASRSIPMIQNQLDQGNKVAIASDGNALTLLQRAFPKLKSFQLPPYDITYKFDSIASNILSQSFKILRAVKNENSFVKELVLNHNYNKIISDNRFGCHHPDCTNIYVTHQLRLLHNVRFIQAAATRLNISMIKHFDECWVPDLPGSQLSGRMSAAVSLDIPVNFIGVQSRFTAIPIPSQPEYHSLSILSGPEPQRSKLEHLLHKQLRDIEGQHIIVTGTECEERRKENVQFKGLCDVEQLTSLISKSKHILSRSGYSSIMDYEAMRRKALLIPTPGQNEQEYLGHVLGKKGRHIVLDQKDLNLKKYLKI